MDRIFVTGASGLLGLALINRFYDDADVYGNYFTHKIKTRRGTWFRLDLNNKLSTLSMIKKIKPDIVVHCAALTDVDLCEENRQLAKKINIDVTKNVIEACKNINCKLVYISTDYVFDGVKGNYNENDEPNPINYYGNTKLYGENLVKASKLNYLIVRTSIFGWNTQNKSSFVENVIKNLRQKNEAKYFNDVYTSMILVNDLADILYKAINTDLRGVYHIASRDRLSKYQIALLIADVFNFDKNLIRPISLDELSKQTNLKARRPKDVSLNVDKAEDDLDLKFPNVSEGILRMKNLESYYKKEFTLA